MSTESARLPSLKERLLQEEQERLKRLEEVEQNADEDDIESRKGRGRRIKSKSKK